MKILVTGGAGYIGSHTCLELLQSNHEVIVVDNLANSNEESLRRIQALSGKTLAFHAVDLLDRDALNAVFANTAIDAVIHFAGLKAVGESVTYPLRYYHNNITATLILCDLMQQYQVTKLVFSSSATVYGDPHSVPIDETFPCAPTNPYGHTKYMIEQILADLQQANPHFNITVLRYFNPVGAHPSGRIGEDPNGIPNNLMPFIAQVAVGKLAQLAVYGNDYPTIDGTGVRDYIHVMDLGSGHLKALESMDRNPGWGLYNLGTGRGYSVLEIVEAFQQASGHSIPYKIGARRPGDIASCYADPTRAAKELGWQAQQDIHAMCADAWRWQKQNPAGYS